ncbi:uroporphyrinogen-III C-methyltransferase [Ileibacterium valens]|uniref:uroporphyrinogen-III C-methyltransferase n=1 Tax=Ileibacterium valens TaxID=1862668 RepID=UPI00235261C0|nr:uroporphyrinogen-III C-methyltransferase [Ileibacterium valens]
MNKNLQYFPAYLNMKSMNVLIVGGGSVALHKAKIMLSFCDSIKVVSRSFLCEFKALAEAENKISPGRLLLIERVFEPDDLIKANLVIGALDDRRINEQIAQEANQRNILCNIVDQPDLCSFIFPAMIQDGLLNVAISTSGASPSVAQYLKHTFENLIPESFSEILKFLKSSRSLVLKTIPDPKIRSKFFRFLFNECLYQNQAIRSNQLGQWLDQCTSNPEDFFSQASLHREVVLAGAGCGSINQLTLEVFKLIETAPVIFYDDLLDPDILKLASGQCIYVGKRKNRHSKNQNEINQQLLEACTKYPWVLRLKGGDPFVFGRGMEEKLFLEKHGIKVRIAPGITSAIAIPQRMNIPVTDRNTGRSFMVISASSQNPDELFSESPSLLAHYQGTLIILMGLTKIKEITNALIQAGKNPDCICAAISSPGISSSLGVSSSLKNLAEDVKKAGLKPPGILVISPAVTYMKDSINSKIVYSSLDSKKTPVSKICIGVISTPGFYQKLKADIHSLHITPVELLSGKVNPLNLSSLKQKLTKISSESPDGICLAFLSENGSRIFLEQLKKEKMDFRFLSSCRIACIGPASAKPFEEAGIYPDLIAARSTTIDFANEINEKISKNMPVISFRCKQAGDQFEKDIQSFHPVIRVNLYELDWSQTDCTDSILSDPSDLLNSLVFGSPESVKAFMQIKSGEISEIMKLPVFCLSKMTGNALSAAGFTKIIQPSEISCQSLAEKISEFFC